MYVCIESLRKGICQNIISDYLWRVDFMGNFIFFFAISIFGSFDKEHIL